MQDKPQIILPEVLVKLSATQQQAAQYGIAKFTVAVGAYFLASRGGDSAQVWSLNVAILDAIRHLNDVIYVAFLEARIDAVEYKNTKDTLVERRAHMLANYVLMQSSTPERRQKLMLKLELELEARNTLHDECGLALFIQDRKRKRNKYKTELTAYHYDMLGEDSCSAYCPVSRSWACFVTSRGRPLFHLIPRIMSNNVANYLLGFHPNTKPADDYGNMLPMDRRIETKLSTCQATFVPVYTAPDRPQEYRIFLVDRRLADRLAYRGFMNPDATQERTWAELEQQTLHFENNERPNLRTVFFHACLAWLKSQQNRWPGHDVLGAELFGHGLWAQGPPPQPPLKLLRGECVSCVAVALGCVLPAGMLVHLFEHSPYANIGFDAAYRRLMVCEFMIAFDMLPVPRDVDAHEDASASEEEDDNDDDDLDDDDGNDVDSDMQVERRSGTTAAATRADSKYQQ